MGLTRFDISEAGEWIGLIGQQFPTAAKKGLFAAALRISQHLMADGRIPVDRGRARAGWRAEATENGADVFNLETSMLFINDGVRAENVRPGRAMIDALAEWAKRKGLGVETVVTKRGTMKKVKPAGSAYRAMAWAIAGAMKKRGIFMPPTKILENTMRDLAPGFVREEVARAIKDEFR